MKHSFLPALWLVLALALGVGSGCADTTEPVEPTPTVACSDAIPAALQACVVARGEATAACYSDTGAACDAASDAYASHLVTLEDTVRGSCADGDFAGLTQDAVVGRIVNACASEADSLSWRTYGGPQGAVWPEASDEMKTCLTSAHASAGDLIDASLQAVNECLATEDCDEAALQETRQGLEEQARTTLAPVCTGMDAVVAIDSDTYIDRAAHQVDCLAAVSHADGGVSAGLKCGPAYAEVEGKRGEWVEVTLDGDKWGTLCGDGSPYVFHIRLAPEGEPLDRVLIGLQGGGVCVFEDDCSDKLASNPGLFTASDDLPFGAAIASTDPDVSPFANWTHVYMPYCTQDVFAGGGVVEEMGDVSVPRYGAVNVRAALRIFRDMLWQTMDAEGGDGFRPDEIITLFGGWSAGAYGSMYNYHYLLDELQWPRTVAFPDAGMGLDNGDILGVKGLGGVKIPAWGATPHLPSYCFAGKCAVGTELIKAISPRLKQVPEQQMLVVTNPRDFVQMGDAYFQDEALWLNTMRQDVCDTRDLPGIHYYLTNVTDDSVHCVTIREELWDDEVDGEVMSDWFWRAVTEPDSLQSRMQEGDLTEQVDGVEPFPCEVSP